MTSAVELARAVQQELRGILTMTTPNRLDPSIGHPAFRPEQAKAMLRIEASYEAFHRLVETDIRSGYFDADPRVVSGPTYAPRKFIGVTLYPIDYDLPGPGWRVVNPMKVRA